MKHFKDTAPRMRFRLTYTTYDNERVTRNMLKPEHAERAAANARAEGHYEIRIWDLDE